MKIGLIDCDGHNFPNLALMRISAYHKALGDSVEWWQTDFVYYDIVYISKVFSSEYSADVQTPLNCGKVVRGGTGYAITIKNGVECFDKIKHKNLPEYIEKMRPDYSIYPQFNFAVSMTSRGCPRGCAFCHVAAKEGRRAVKVANVSDFWDGQKEIKILDPNITAVKESDKRDLMQQYIRTGAYIDFTQGIDIRLCTDTDIDSINEMKIKQIHFAWDRPEDDLKPHFYRYAEKAKHKPHGKYGAVYCLTGFNSTIEQDLYRIYTLRDLGFDPYVMIYNKPNAPKILKRLQRWCNNRFIFSSCPNFNDYY